MTTIRWISAGVVASGVLLLSGCVAVPGSYGYDNNAYYAQPSYPTYYNEPAPVVVSPSVYLQGGTYYDRGYSDRGYHGRDNRRYYDERERGYNSGRRPEHEQRSERAQQVRPDVQRRIEQQNERMRRSGFAPDGRPSQQ